MNNEENFKDHEITVVHDGEYVKKFLFRKPGTGTFGFSLVTSDNLIAMTGDCYSLMITPGYGRCGLAFLRGSLKSEGYFLSKCPFPRELTEYSFEEACKNINEYREGDDPLITDENFDEEFLDDESWYAEFKYYDYCHAMNIDEPSSPMVLRQQTLIQLAGLQCFIEKYEEMINGSSV